MNSPFEISKLCIIYGINKIKRPKIKMLILSILGGFFIGGSACLSLICGYYFVGGKAQYYRGLVFPMGMAAIYCGGAELFMSNCLLIIPCLLKKITVLEMLLSWLIVFIGNFIGSILMSLLIVYSHIPNMFEVNLAQTIIINGINKCASKFAETFIQGLLCNIFVCLGVWVSLGGRDIRSIILGLWTPVFFVEACNLQHSVANMYYITSALFASYEYGLDNITLNWGKLFYKNIIPVSLGNIFGGGFVAFIYYYVYLTTDEREIVKVKHRKHNIDKKLNNNGNLNKNISDINKSNNDNNNIKNNINNNIKNNSDNNNIDKDKNNVDNITNDNKNTDEKNKNLTNDLTTLNSLVPNK